MKAWIENNMVRDVCAGDPLATYHPDIAAYYTTDVPAGTVNGATLVEGVWANPPPPVDPGPPAPVVVVDPCEWFIDIGPFFDRFGVAKMAVLTCTDAGVKAILQDVQVRKWIDLQRTDVASSLAYIGSVVPAVNGALQTSILTATVAAEENLALRKMYFT